MKIQELVDELLHPVRLIWLICRLDNKEDEGAVSDGLVNRKNKRWNGFWKHSAKYLSQWEIYCSRIAQPNRWIRGRLIVREENWCKRVEQHQRESAVIACGGNTSCWGRRGVLWIVYSWRQLSQKTNFHVEKYGLRLYCMCWLIRGHFVLRVWLV